MPRGPFRGSKGSFLRHGVSHLVIRRITPRDTAYLFLGSPRPLFGTPRLDIHLSSGKGVGIPRFDTPFHARLKSPARPPFLRHGVSHLVIRRITPRDTAYLFLPLLTPLRPPPKTSPFFTLNSEPKKDPFWGVMPRGPFRGSKGPFLRHGVSRPVIRRITPRDTAYHTPRYGVSHPEIRRISFWGPLRPFLRHGILDRIWGEDWLRRRGYSLTSSVGRIKVKGAFMRKV